MARDNDKYVLNEHFLNELLRMCFMRKEVIDACVNCLKFHYISSEPYKEIWTSLRNHYVSNNEIPSFGTVYQSLQSSLGKKASVTLSTLSSIKETNIVSTSEILKKLEEFIKDSMSVEFFNEFGEKYTSGDKDGARSLLKKKSEEINQFSIFRGTGMYERVFGGFESRNESRQYDHETYGQDHDKIPFSINELDDITKGGSDVTDTFCLLTRSGVGKTKFLRHVGIGAVRRGKNVLHIQAEGSKSSCLNGYDATWTACLMSDIRKGSIPPDKYDSLKKVVSSMKSKGSDIYVHAFEQFGQASMKDVRSIATDLLKQVSSIDLILCDYLELFDPADGVKYSPNDERHKRLSIANKMKNIAVELHTRVGTCTQANDIPPKLLDDPDFVLTRHNVSECKGLVNPFSFFFSGNQTSDEYNDNQMRLYVDKLRDHKANQIIKICQAYQYDRFYDHKRTMSLLDKTQGE